MAVLERSSTSIMTYTHISPRQLIEPEENFDPVAIFIHTVEFNSRLFPILFERFDDQTWAAYFVNCENIIASGDTFQEAFTNLIEESQETYDELEKDAEYLSPDLVTQLEFLKQVFADDVE